MNGDVLRSARADEVQMLSELALRSKGYWGYDAAFLEACREELTGRVADIESRHVTVLEREGKVLGFYGPDGEAPEGELSWLLSSQTQSGPSPVARSGRMRGKPHSA